MGHVMLNAEAELLVLNPKIIEVLQMERYKIGSPRV